MLKYCHFHKQKLDEALFLQLELLSHQQITGESENKRKHSDEFFKFIFHHQFLS